MDVERHGGASAEFEKPVTEMLGGGVLSNSEGVGNDRLVYLAGVHKNLRKPRSCFRLAAS